MVVFIGILQWYSTLAVIISLLSTLSTVNIGSEHSTNRTSHDGTTTIVKRQAFEDYYYLWKGKHGSVMMLFRKAKMILQG